MATVDRFVSKNARTASQELFGLYDHLQKMPQPLPQRLRLLRLGNVGNVAEESTEIPQVISSLRRGPTGSFLNQSFGDSLAQFSFSFGAGV